MLSIWQKIGLSCKDESHRRLVPFVREILYEGAIELKKIHMKENLADMLTKIVPGVKFAHCKKILHIFPVA